jgi:DNA-binding CsgD family transcriptional regulator
MRQEVVMLATEQGCILIINGSLILGEWLVRELCTENYDVVTADAGERAARPSFVFLSVLNDWSSGPVRRQCGSDDYLPQPIDRGMLGIVSENQLLHQEDSSGSPSENGLTGRQREVLTWVGRGKTSSEVAIILGLSERTVNFHCDHAVKRLEVANRTQAVAKAIAHGLIPS